VATKWDYGVVAFIDVLGFSSLVAADAASLEPSHLDRLRTSLQEVKAAAVDLDIRAFSDSIVISSALTSANVTNLLQSVLNLQRIFVRRSVLVRGAIAFGKHFADLDLIYSEALIRAYQEERDHARFPRILVNKDLLDWLMHDAGTTEEIKTAVNLLLLTDRDNRVFLNYLSVGALESHLKLLNGYDTGAATASVLEKIQWLAEYHNYVAGKAGSTFSCDGPLLRGFRPHTAAP
jgi:hypothetical protein